MKNLFENIYTTYGDNLEKYESRETASGKTRPLQKIKDESYIDSIKKDVDNWFSDIISMYPGLNVRMNYGFNYNVASMPWLMIYCGHKNSKGTSGDYCGISFDKEKDLLEIWIGFGRNYEPNKVIIETKEKKESIYRLLLGNDLDRDFSYSTQEVNAIIIEKKINIFKLDIEEVKKDIIYIVDCYYKYLNYNEQSREIINILTKPTNLPKSSHLMGINKIYSGFPGCGKSTQVENTYLRDKDGELINSELYERVVFYPEYSYSDFIGTIRPVINNYQPKYEFIPGPFTKILKKAISNPESNFYLIVEELNRGDAESIFGDIFQLLDRENANGRSNYSITNSLIAEEVFNDENHDVYLPNNLSIIATMNSTDENVKTLDSAFERRFEKEWVLDSKGKYDDQYLLGMEGLTWGKFRNTINSYIRTQKGLNKNEDKQLGAYFIDQTYVSEVPSDNKYDSRKRFLYKVVLHLYQKIRKYENILFSDDIDCINILVEKFSSNNYLSIFRKEIVDEFLKRDS